MTATQDLAKFVVSTFYEDIPQPVIDKAKLAILDSIGCAFVGSQSAIGRPIVELALELNGKPESTVIGTSKKVSSLHAAWANAESANALDYDDAFPYAGHPGATTIHTALALGEALGITGKELLTAIVIGYEISPRIAQAILPSRDYYGLTSGHSFMVFGTAAIASKLLDLNETQTTWAIGTAAAAAPIPSDKKCTINPYNVHVGAPSVKNNYGQSALLGIRSALLAQRGYTGPIDILEGDTGFFRMFGSDQCDLAAVTKGLGETFILPQLGFKPYACCRLYHATLDAGLAIQQEHSISFDDIDEITVHTFSVKTVPPADDPTPKTLQSAADSIPYSLVVALSGIPPGLGWFEEKTLQDPNILSLCKHVKLIPDPTADAIRKEGHYSVATVEMKSKGKTYSKRVDTPKGDSRNPMTIEELEQKYLRLTRTILSENNTQQTMQMINNIETLQNIQILTDLFH